MGGSGFGIYGGRGNSRLLGGVTSVLSGGRCKQVTLDPRASTGSAQYADPTRVRRIVIPAEESLPDGFGLDDVRGLLDHETGHAIWSDFVGFCPQDALPAYR